MTTDSIRAQRYDGKQVGVDVGLSAVQTTEGMMIVAYVRERKEDE